MFQLGVIILYLAYEILKTVIKSDSIYKNMTSKMTSFYTLAKW